uniref:NPH3 domain-containing protein n=1 Tax=Oryza brachyantha TaxID=4533 RepID=J3M2K8_ORYBR
MNELCDLKVHINGHHTLLLHQSVMCAFSGRLRTMVTHERRKKKTSRVEALSVKLTDFPGGAEGFELVARFCYSNGRVPLCPSNLPVLHCAAVYLEMTDEACTCNLLTQAEAFVDGLYYWTWADVLTAVKSCEPFAAAADASGLLEKLISALFSKITANPETPVAAAAVGTPNRSSSSCSSSPDTLGFGRSSSTKTPDSMKPCFAREWWFDDMTSLCPQTIEKATLDDLLVSGDDGGVYDVNLVMRLVRVFVSSEEEADLPSQRMRKVGRLVDKYLGEISPDHGLRVSKFLAVAESLPDSARECYDGVYRALDIYLESHPTLTIEERTTLCRCLNYEKLTLEACKDLAKNRRIPPGIAVQALGSQQSKLQIRPAAAVAKGAGGRPDPSQTPRKVVVGGGGGRARSVDLDSMDEKELLKLNLQKMQNRVVELERACKEMRGQMSKMAKGGSLKEICETNLLGL